MEQKNTHRFSNRLYHTMSLLSKNRRAQITLYSVAICPWCRAAKDFLKEHQIRFREFDVARNQNAFRRMIQKSGQMSVPVIEVNDSIIVGFDQDALEKKLNL